MENRFQEAIHSTFSYCKVDTRETQLFPLLLLCISCSMSLLPWVISLLGEGKERKGVLLSPRLRKKQNNYSSNMTMVLQQVVAA